MGIQINGITDTITATDGGLVVSGQQLTGVTDINASGIVTASQVQVGTSVTVHTSGFQVGSSNVHSTGASFNNINSTGIITATSFIGDGSQLSNIISGVGIRSTGALIGTGFTTLNFIGAGNTFAVNGTTIDISISGGGTADVRTNSLVVSGVSTFSAGSASSPSLSPTGDSNTGIFFPASDTIAFSKGGAEASRIDSSGRFFIGTTVSVNDNIDGTGYANIVQIEGAGAGSGLVVRNTSTSRINISRIGSFANDTWVGALSFSAHTGPTIERARISGYTETTGGTGGYGGNLRFYTGDDGSATMTERMRITNTGGVVFEYSNTTGVINSFDHGGYGYGGNANTNSTTLTDQKCAWFLRSSMQNTNNELGNSILLLQDSGGAAINPGDIIKGYRGSTFVFRVANDGSLRNSTGSYAAISDERLKQDIVDAPSQWDDIKAVKFKKFKLKNDVERSAEHPELGEAPYMLGVIAQEIEQVSPGLIDVAKLDDGTPDPDSMKSVKYSILYMKAVRALQEAMERIEVLEEKVNILENKS